MYAGECQRLGDRDLLRLARSKPLANLAVKNVFRAHVQPENLLQDIERTLSMYRTLRSASS